MVDWKKRYALTLIQAEIDTKKVKEIIFRVIEEMNDILRKVGVESEIKYTPGDLIKFPSNLYIKVYFNEKEREVIFEKQMCIDGYLSKTNKSVKVFVSAGFYMVRYRNSKLIEPVKKDEFTEINCPLMESIFEYLIVS